MPSSSPELPAGVTVGHWTDPVGWTGCTVILLPRGSVAAAEVRGGGPGTRETDLLTPAAHAPGVQALLLAGGSAFGLAAADGVTRWLSEQGLGHETPWALVPLVPAAVVYDLGLGDPGAHPDAAAGHAACAAATARPERGDVGVGTGCTVGKLRGPEGWTKGGLGIASTRYEGAVVSAVAAVNALGEVVGEDGRVLAGVWGDRGWESSIALLRGGVRPRVGARESTTLACVVTDAALTKTDAWRTARVGSAGVARAVNPSATSYDGDVVFCAATGAVELDPLFLPAIAAEVVTAAIRDAVRSAQGAPGCPPAAARGG